MENLENWTEVTRGLYRYVVAAKVCYEIHILHYEDGTDISTAKASLFLVGNWRGESGGYFSRDCLLADQPVFECLNAACADDMANNG